MKYTITGSAADIIRAQGYEISVAADEREAFMMAGQGWLSVENPHLDIHVEESYPFHRFMFRKVEHDVFRQVRRAVARERRNVVREQPCN